jgi:peptide/nickel transport system substrate-binding protein
MRHLLLVGALVAMQVGAAFGQMPQRGGTLTTVVESEPNTLDCHAAATSFVLQVLSQHYSTLLRFDPDNYPKIEGDVADTWSVSPDGLTYTFKLRHGVLFHDGSTLTAEDVKATYDRLRDPPQGVISARKGQFSDLTKIDVQDPWTIVFTLAKRNDAMLIAFASPWNCLYSAKKLAADPKFPEANVMGTGPFVFGEYVKGSYWLAKRFDRYFRSGKPYLDEIKSVFMSGPAVINALAGGQVDSTFFLIAPPDVERIKAARGDRTAFQSAQLNVFQFVTLNTKRKPFDDVRVRRALNLAIDRRQGEKDLSKITILKDFGSIIPPGAALALTPEEIVRMPGMGADIAAARAEAKRLLAEAGVPDLKLKLLNRNLRQPWEPAGIFVIDQWRQIGVTAEMVVAETPAYFGALNSGSFDVALDFNNSISDDPTVILVKYIPGASGNYSGVVDDELKDLAAKQQATSDQAERKKLVTAFQKRMLDQAYFIPTFWGYRSVAMPANLRGWKLPPSTVLNLDMANVWLAK